MRRGSRLPLSLVAVRFLQVPSPQRDCKNASIVKLLKVTAPVDLQEVNKPTETLTVQCGVISLQHIPSCQIGETCDIHFVKNFTGANSSRWPFLRLEAALRGRQGVHLWQLFLSVTVG